MRKQYNEFGKSRKDGGEADDMVDPEAIFSTLFGGERFQDIIGTISLGSEMKSAMQADEDDEDDSAAASGGAAAGASGSTVATTVDPKTGKPVTTKPALTPEQEARKKAKEEQEARAVAEKAKVREQRVKHLADKLRDKLALFSEQASGEEDAQIAEGGAFDSRSLSARSESPTLMPNSCSQCARCGRSRPRSSRRSRTASNYCMPSAWYTR